MSSTRLLNLMSFMTFIAIAISHPKCGLYGAPPCQYVPAPPGHTPSCARPGKTYCEHVDTYPVRLIKHLIHKWGYESKNLIVDETGDEFDSVRHRSQDIFHPSAIFGPPSANHLGQFEGYSYDVPSSTINGGSTYTNDGYSGEPIYIPKPEDSEYSIYTSITAPNFGKTANSYTDYNYGSKVSHYNPGDWLKRFARDLSQIKKQHNLYNDTRMEEKNNQTRLASGEATAKFLDLLSKDEKAVNQHHRSKRQSPSRESLCEVNTQFIMPQAALNSRGNWMYVVNESAERQLVKTETCASTVCSNLCQPRNGYSSSCEQKYVQKRLVALNGNGQNLYTDTFWFPSCCVCILSN